MIAVLHQVIASRTDFSIEDVLFVQVVPSVETVKVKQPAKDHHFFGNFESQISASIGSAS